MNITLESDREVDVTVELRFVGGIPHEFHIRLSGYGPLNYCVIGRSPQELTNIFLSYNNIGYEYPIMASDGMNLDPINIYGGRDHWSQLLRDKALESPIGSTTPEDKSPYND